MKCRKIFLDLKCEKDLLGSVLCILSPDHLWNRVSLLFYGCAGQEKSFLGVNFYARNYFLGLMVSYPSLSIPILNTNEYHPGKFSRNW